MSNSDSAISSEPKVAVVSPIHNAVDLTVRMLESFEKVTYPNFELILVDLGSSDGSRDTIRSRFPHVILIDASSDLWWSEGTNVGVKEALRRGCDYVFTVNNDVVVEPDVLGAVIEVARSNPASLVGCKVLEMHRRSRVWFFGQGFDRGGGDVVTVSGWDEEFQEPRSAEMLTGMGMLIPSDAFERVGFFDGERFPHYFGDSDFSLRARAQGFDLIVTPQAKIYNDLSSSWAARELASGKLRFLLRMATSERSAYSFGVRKRFYRLYWGPGWRMALGRLYVTMIRTYLPALLKNKLRSGSGTQGARGSGATEGLDDLALCHEWITTYGGSEQVAARIARVLEIDRVYAFTARAELAKDLFPSSSVVTIHPIGRSAFVQDRWQWFLPLMGFLWSRVDLSGFSVVVTSSHSSVNSIRVRRGAAHLCYCHTPMRYAWEWRSEAHRLPAAMRPLMPVIATWLRASDRRRVRRVTAFAANSRFVADRIHRHYGRSATVIYPPVDTTFWSPAGVERQNYFLLAGRLVAYKRAEVAVQAAGLTGLRLVVAGSGPELPRLRRMATDSVTFLENPSAEELRDLYREAQALVFPGVEDFGMTMVEAQACGTPVIAQRAGGALEAVSPGRTGILYEGASPEDLAEAMESFEPSLYRSEWAVEHARRFDTRRFDEAFKAFVDSYRREPTGSRSSQVTD